MAPFSSLPEVVTPPQSHGIEVAGSTEKQGVPPYAYGLPSTPSDSLASAPSTKVPQQDDEDAPKGARRRKPLVWICFAIAALAALAVALGAGLGIRLKSEQNAKDSSDNLQSGSGHGSGDSSSVDTNGAFVSAKGAFDGTGLALLSGRFSNISSSGPDDGADEDPNLMLFFQHAKGEIRWVQQTSPDSWDGGSTHEVVASDAKNGTPIAAMSARPDGVRQWHVFYVDDSNTLRQRSIDNLTYTWTDGLLSNMHLKLLDADSVGLRACFYPGPIDSTNLNGTSPLAGIRIFAATSETTFDQVSWRSGLSKWVWEQRWTGLNGHANPACMGWGRGSVTYAMFVNEGNAANVFWKDTSYDQTSTEAHPINQWKNTTISLPSLSPTAGLAWHGGLYAKPAGRNTLQGWNLTLAAENSSANAASVLSTVGGGGGVPAPNTRLDIWSYPSGASVEGTEEIMVVYQSEGGALTLATGDVATGTWTDAVLPVPDD